ncbi:integrase core domain-containing protein [Allosediminivita pacifica]|uniref:integrase core domain-containing protein n=1 Tax=Allosediminivita pacifica TaxID=1267769 RepID=UPI003570F415
MEGESADARLRNELLDATVFYSLRDEQTLTERWRRHYNTVRPHGAFGYMSQVPESIVSVERQPTMQ